MVFIRPIINFGDVVWGNCTKETLNCLKMYKPATRQITGLKANSSKSILYSELGWETLQSQEISN